MMTNTRAFIALLLVLAPTLALAAQGCMNIVAQGPNGVKDVPSTVSVGANDNMAARGIMW